MTCTRNLIGKISSPLMTADGMLYGYRETGKGLQFVRLNDLYIDGEFSHCGMDSFSLLETEERWKITGIVSSMEAENCAPSPLGPLEKMR